MYVVVIWLSPILNLNHYLPDLVNKYSNSEMASVSLFFHVTCHTCYNVISSNLLDNLDYLTNC